MLPYITANYKVQNYTENNNMEILLSMRSQSYRTRNNSIFILNLFALQFISLIALSRLGSFYLKIAQLLLIIVDDDWTFSSLCVIINLSFNLLIVGSFVLIKIFSKFKYRQSIINAMGFFILNFKYVLLIPVGCINVRPLMNADVSLQFKVICAFNMVITFILSAIELYTNWSNRFIENDYCNRRENSILCLLFQFGFVSSTIILGSLVGSLFLIAVSIFRAYQVSITVEFNLIQSSTFFYSCFNIYMCIICLIGDHKLGFLELTCKIIIGVIVSLRFSEAACNCINTYYGNSKNLYKLNKTFNAEKSQKQNLELQQENKSLNNFKDLIILSRIVLNRIKIMKNPKERNNEWSIWWQKYILALVSHRIICTSEKCDCKKKDKSPESQFNVVMDDMRKYMQKLEEQDKSLDVRIMGIYLNVEIINKPLKAYYEIIRMGEEEASVANSVDLQCLITQTRECFSRIFLLNNIQNSNLPLMKIIKFEELVESLEVQTKQVLQANINFNDLFTLNSVKIIQVINESKRIFDLKQKIGDKLEDLVINYPDSFRVGFFIYIFYQYLEPYRSRQKQFKIISQQKNLKRRLFQKQDQDIFSAEHGVIYIDMVEQRGKIKKITKNICELYGHNYEDMVSFNINKFMPQIFSKHHHKFLTNFIEFGKIKILAEKRRLVFGKNKNKFIFPIYVRMKTEHLLHNEFGVTALVKKMDTTNQYIIFSQNGKIQQMTERIYKTLFYPCLKTEVDKTRRLCLIKMIPKIIQIITDPNFDAKVQNIHESLFIFSQQADMLQKFKTYKEPRQHESGFQSSGSYVASVDAQLSSESASENSSGFVYYSEVFKTFLNDLNIIKLNSFLINYKISKLKTQEFTVFLLEIISIEAAENQYMAAIDEYRKVSESLGIFEQYGCIHENFEKTKRIIEQADVLNYMFNKNVPSDNHLKMMRRSDERGYRKKIIKIMDGQNKEEQPELIPDNSQFNKLNEIGNIKNQAELVQRGGSERSSITDQSQSQSKKQMLINAFNTDNIRVSTKLLLFINITVAVKLAILLAFVIISIEEINKMYSEELKNVMNLNLKQIYEYRLAVDQIDTFYALIQARNYNVQQSQLADILTLKEQLNNEFTQNLMTLKKINQYTSSAKEELYQMIYNYDPYLKTNIKITLIELLNKLDFIFRSPTANTQSDYFELNYVAIHNKFQQICSNDIETTINSKLSKNSIPLIILGLYQFFVVTLALLWIPILYFVSKQEKRIINLLSTMNVRELKRVTNKLRILLQNMKTSKVKQINETMNLLNDEKLENAIEMQKQKSMTRNIRLVEEQGSYTVKPKIVAALIFAFMIIFSILPITVHFNLMADDDKYYRILRIMQETSMLADKVPTLANIYVTNLNKIYSSSNIQQFPSSLYFSAQANYFNLTELISKTDDVSKNLVSKSGSEKQFSDNMCLSIECSNYQQASKVKFYDQILLIRNSFSILGPSKLNIINKMSQTDIDKWVNETNAIEIMGWVSKIYRFSHLWNNRFKSQIQTTLDSTKQRLIILASILLPVYIFTVIYVEMWLIKKMSQILKSAEAIHMHFPVQILAENTYLTSYFNDKIKNSK